MIWIDKIAIASSKEVIDNYRELSKSEDIFLCDVREFIDKEGNLPDKIAEKIKLCVEELKKGKKVLIFCDYGISRSSSIACGVLSVIRKIRFAESVMIVSEKIGHGNMNPGVLMAVKKAIEKINESSTSEEEKKSLKKRKRILCTGGNGFIGRKIREKTEDEKKQEDDELELIWIKREDVDLEREGTKIIYWVESYEPYAILHLANPKHYNTNEAFGKSISMLKNILDICKYYGLKIFFPSSWVVFSGLRGDIIADEHTPPLPSDTYSLSKYISENIIKFFSEQYGIDYCIMRIGPVYGPGGDRPRFIINFIEKAIKNEDIVYHEYLNGPPKLDLIYIEDVSEAIILTLKKDISGIINIGGQKLYSTREIAEIIKELTNSKSKILPNKIMTLHANIKLSIERAKEVLGWYPKTNVKDGLKDIIKSISGNQKIGTKNKITT